MIWCHGWNDSNIPEWLEQNAQYLPASACVALTTIDSGRTVSSSRVLADALGREPEVPGREMYMSVEELVRLASTIFAGFEEAWVLAAKPTQPFEDAPVRLDCSESMDAPSIEFIDWLERFEVLVGLGDGLGLAYVCRQSEETAKLVFK